MSCSPTALLTGQPRSKPAQLGGATQLGLPPLPHCYSFSPQPASLPAVSNGGGSPAMQPCPAPPPPSWTVRCRQEQGREDPAACAVPPGGQQWSTVYKEWLGILGSRSHWFAPAQPHPWRYVFVTDPALHALTLLCFLAMPVPVLVLLPDQDPPLGPSWHVSGVHVWLQLGLDTHNVLPSPAHGGSAHQAMSG